MASSASPAARHSSASSRSPDRCAARTSSRRSRTWSSYGVSANGSSVCAGRADDNRSRARSGDPSRWSETAAETASSRSTTSTSTIALSSITLSRSATTISGPSMPRRIDSSVESRWARVNASSSGHMASHSSLRGTARPCLATSTRSRSRARLDCQASGGTGSPPTTTSKRPNVLIVTRPGGPMVDGSTVRRAAATLAAVRSRAVLPRPTPGAGRRGRRRAPRRPPARCGTPPAGQQTRS